MERVELGCGLAVSAFCYGTAEIGAKVQGAEADRLLNLYRDAGGNFLDSAHIYAFWSDTGDGSSERALADYFRRNGGRDEMIVATKGGHPSVHVYQRPSPHLAPERVKADLLESLGRLETDRIDFYWLHRDEPERSVAEIIDYLNDFREQGLIDHFGASNWTVERIAEAGDYARRTGKRGFAASQPQWSLACIEPNDGPGDTRYFGQREGAYHARTSLPVICYSPTAKGLFATGRIDRKYDNPRTRSRLARCRQLAQRIGATPGQVALAWLRSHPWPVVPILGSTNPDHLAEDLGADGIELTSEQRHWLAEGE